MVALGGVMLHNGTRRETGSSLSNLILFIGQAKFPSSVNQEVKGANYTVFHPHSL